MFYKVVLWSVVAVAVGALFYVLIIDPSIIAVAPFAFGCLLELIKGQSCAP